MTRIIPHFMRYDWDWLVLMNKSFYYTLKKYCTKELKPVHIELLMLMVECGFNRSCALHTSVIRRRYPTAYGESTLRLYVKNLLDLGLIEQRTRGSYLLSHAGWKLIGSFRRDLLLRFQHYLTKEDLG